MICKKCSREIADTSVYCMHCGWRQSYPYVKHRKRSNGEGSIFRLPDGRYKAEVVLGYWEENLHLHKKVATRVCKTKKDAVAAIVELKARPFESFETNPTLSYLYSRYSNSDAFDKLSLSQRNKLSYAWDRLEPLHYCRIQQLTVDMLQRCIDTATKTYYPAHDMKVLLSHLYNLAIRMEVVSVNKSELLELPDKPAAKKDRWTDSELNALWADYDANAFTGYILIMIYAGLRYGELSTLLIENIDLERHVMIGGIKTEAGINREIPIADRILPIVTECYYNNRYKLLEMNEDTFYKRYWETIERTGLRKLPPHTCRHTYFSLMTAAGIQAGIITETGGHASYLTTMKNYVTLSLEEKLNAVNKI